MSRAITFFHRTIDLNRRPNDSIICGVDHALVLSFDKVGKHRDFVFDLLWKLSDTKRMLVGLVRHYEQDIVLAEIDSYRLAAGERLLLPTRGDWLWLLTTDEFLLRRFLDKNWSTFGGNWLFFTDPSDDLVRKMAAPPNGPPKQNELTRWRDDLLLECFEAGITFDDDIVDIASIRLGEPEAVQRIKSTAARYGLKLRERT